MGKVKPIPKGYHSLTTSLCVQGANDFIKFCKKAFGAKEVSRMSGPGGSVMHAELLIGNSHLMLGDEDPAWGIKSAKTLKGSPATLHLYVEDCDAVFKKAVAAGATVTMPPADMFWGDRYGKVEDPFGNLWGILTHKEDVSPREMKKREKAWMKAAAGSGQ